MSAGILRGWLDGARASVTWVEYDDYAGRVFAGAPPDWLTQAARFAATLGQARKVIRTQVLTIDLSAPCLARARADGSAVERALQALDDPAARAFGAEALDALAHKFAGDTDLVLKISSPRDLLRRCGADGEPSFNELDDLASALVGLLRALSDKPVAALLVARAGKAAWTMDEADACEPIFGAAHHYGWLTAMSVEHALAAGGAPEGAAIDLLLCADADPAMLTRSGRPRIGGGLPAAYWTGDGPAAPTPGVLAYGVIPVDAEPERILERCAGLNGP